MIWSGTLLNAVWPLFDSEAERLELAMLLWLPQVMPIATGHHGSATVALGRLLHHGERWSSCQRVQQQRPMVLSRRAACQEARARYRE